MDKIPYKLMLKTPKHSWD